MKDKGLSPICLLTFLLLSLSGCIDEYEADIHAEDSDLLVVEGTICSSRENMFILSRTKEINSEQTLRMVTGATVSVRGSDGSEYMTQDGGGYYCCQMGILAPDVEYYLHIETDGEVYESEPQKPLRTEKIADVCGVQNTPESNIDVLVTPDVPFESDKTNYYCWTYDETWEVHPNYTTNMYFDTNLKRAFFKEHQFPERGWKDAIGSTIMVGASSNYEGQHILRLKMYDLDRSEERVFHRYSGLIHQRAISKAEYEYQLARREAGSEMGGLFTPLPSALPTNIHCVTSLKHVIGFVGCALNMSEYRFFLDASDFSVQYPKNDTRLWETNPNMNYCCRLVNEGMYLCVWEDNRLSGGDLKTAWAYEYQLDVRLNGAYIEEPYFWSYEENVSY